MSTGERGEPIVPVMHCWEEKLPDGTPVWFFQCPHCNCKHMHGAGPGHRFARCGSDSPFFKHGYILAIKASASAEDSRSRIYGYALGLREPSSRPPNLPVSPKPAVSFLHPIECGVLSPSSAEVRYRTTNTGTLPSARTSDV